MKFTSVLALIAGAATSTAALAADVSRDEVRAIVAEALADAQTRSSLLQGGGAAGYDRGFYIASPNGDWKMNINGAIQFRYVINNRDDTALPVPPNGASGNFDDFSQGFQLRRAYLAFSGNMVNPNLEYVIRLVTQSTGGTSTGDFVAPGAPIAGTFNSGGSGNGAAFDDVYMRYNFGNGWKIKAGQFKGAFLKENSNPDTATMAVERGIMHHAFNPSRTQGISLSYEADMWRGCIEVTDGFNAIGSDFNDSPPGGVGFGTRASGESEFAFTGRLEYLFAGKWDAVKDYTSKPGDATAGYIGIAGHWEQSTNVNASNLGPGSVNETDWFGLTVDAQWESNGWGVFGAIALASASPSLAGTQDTTDWGACLQVSYRWDEAPEVFLRWDGIMADDNRGFNEDDMHFITFGFNNYFAGNSCKLSVDVLWSLNETDFAGPFGGPAFAPGLSNNSFVPGASVPGSGVNAGPATLNSSNGLQGSADSGEFAIRAQWQIAF